MYGETYTPEVVGTLKQLFQEALAACPADETNIYRRRVAWMQEGFARFLSDADLAHKWMGKTLSYKVTNVAKPPADAAAWQALPALTLLRGNFGRAPDLTTRVWAARCGDDLFLRFEAVEPTEPLLWDRLALVVEAGDEERARARGGGARPAWIPEGEWILDPERFLAVNGEGECEGPLQPTLISNTYADGLWTAVVKCPAAALGIGARQAKTVEVQFERKRAARRKVSASEYYWTPPMKPQWLHHVRFGRLEVAAN
jgi:hypothetical protein